MYSRWELSFNKDKLQFNKVVNSMAIETIYYILGHYYIRKISLVVETSNSILPLIFPPFALVNGKHRKNKESSVPSDRDPLSFYN